MTMFWNVTQSYAEVTKSCKWSYSSNILHEYSPDTASCFLLLPCLVTLLTLQITLSCLHLKIWFYSHRIQVIWQQLFFFFNNSFPLDYDKVSKPLMLKFLHRSLFFRLKISNVSHMHLFPFRKQVGEGWKLKSQYSIYLILTLITRLRHNVISPVYLWLASYDPNQTELTKKISCWLNRSFVIY